MGIFGKNKPKTEEVSSQKLSPVIEKFQSWIPDDLSSEVNGKKIDAKNLKTDVANLILQAAKNEDVQLLQFVGKACAGFTDQVRAESIENLAQWVYDISSVSLELQKKYSNKAVELDSIKSLGLVAHNQIKTLNSYSQVLDYLGKNAKKLDENRA